MGKEFPELLCHFPVVVPNHVRVAHGCAWVGVPQTILPHLHRSVQVIEQACVPMPEGMCRPIQSELLQDGFQLPLDEVVRVQATTFCTQEKWLVGIPSLDVEPRALGSCVERGLLLWFRININDARLSIEGSAGSPALALLFRTAKLSHY